MSSKNNRTGFTTNARVFSPLFYQGSATFITAQYVYLDYVYWYEFQESDRGHSSEESLNHQLN